MEPEVVIVVPVLDGAEVIADVLDALGSQVGAPSNEVVVVDNGSTDDTVNIVRGHWSGARLLEEPRRGSYAARNRGIRETHSPILAFTDADCLPAPDWLRQLVDPLQRGDADLVGGAIEPVVDDTSTRWARYEAAMYLDQATHVAGERFAATANLGVARAVLEDLGGFDEELLSGGDMYLCRRATQAGYVLVNEPLAVVAHRPRTDLKGTWRLHRRLGAGWAALARRGERPPPWRDPALRISLRWVASRTRRHGRPIRARSLAAVHAVAMTARWMGRLTGR